MSAAESIKGGAEALKEAPVVATAAAYWETMSAETMSLLTEERVKDRLRGSRQGGCASRTHQLDPRVFRARLCFLHLESTMTFKDIGLKLTQPAPPTSREELEQWRGAVVASVEARLLQAGRDQWRD